MYNKGIEAVVATTPNQEVIHTLATDMSRSVLACKKALVEGNPAQAMEHLAVLGMLSSYLSSLDKKMGGTSSRTKVL